MAFYLAYLIIFGIVLIVVIYPGMIVAGIDLGMMV
jgi:hypothetical protein